VHGGRPKVCAKARLRLVTDLHPRHTVPRFSRLIFGPLSALPAASSHVYEVYGASLVQVCVAVRPVALPCGAGSGRRLLASPDLASATHGADRVTDVGAGGTSVSGAGTDPRRDRPPIPRCVVPP